MKNPRVKKQTNNNPQIEQKISQNHIKHIKTHKKPRNLHKTTLKSNVSLLKYKRKKFFLRINENLRKTQICFVFQIIFIYFSIYFQ